MLTISVLNYKGGVGKTTFTLNCAQALSILGKRVLVIDNDGQHNLSLQLCADLNPESTLKDVYRNSLGNASRAFVNAIQETKLTKLHVVPSEATLSNMDVKDTDILKNTIKYCSIAKFYDYCFIDNPPGLDSLQKASVLSSDSIFIPTELSYFALNGLRELNKIILDEFRGDISIDCIIPNFFKGTKNQKSYIKELDSIFPGKVSKTYIPPDSVFDVCMRERKFLFLHRLYTKGAAYYLKLVNELFPVDEDDSWHRMKRERDSTLRKEARKRYYISKPQDREQQEGTGLSKKPAIHDSIKGRGDKNKDLPRKFI
ncbi:MAG: ParA family protein [Chitinivibrionales bacterium]